MESVYQKMNDLMKENAELKKRIIDLEAQSGLRKMEIENIYLKGKIESLEGEIQKLKFRNINEDGNKENFDNKIINLGIVNHENVDSLKQKISDLESELSDTKKVNETFRSAIKEIRNHVLGLLGYKIEFIDNQVVLLSAYAFDRDDVFIFQKNGDQMELINNEFASQWMKEIDAYMVKNGSIPAFLASVTMELYNQKTFN
ncbi:Mitotic spindle assembly checkpoint protein MAD1 [Dictyocoela muelleri]|nr:Mitotic spindle assembly checkpoint protein MAD1 [Dictyocoela muelleri]